MGLEKIERPANVHVPRSVERRIQARRALEEGTVETMRSELRNLGVKVPSGADKETLQGMLHEVAGGGALIGRSPAPPEDKPAAAAKTGGDK